MELVLGRLTHLLGERKTSLGSEDTADDCGEQHVTAYISLESI